MWQQKGGGGSLLHPSSPWSRFPVLVRVDVLWLRKRAGVFLGCLQALAGMSLQPSKKVPEPKVESEMR